jgi:hypothetical protein
MGRKDYEIELNTISLLFQEVYEPFQYRLQSPRISPSLTGFTGTDVSEAFTSSNFSVADAGSTLFETLIPINQSVQYQVREDNNAHIYSCGNLESHITEYTKIYMNSKCRSILRVPWRGALKRTLSRKSDYLKPF